MRLFDILAPTLVLVLLGYGLGRKSFLGPQFLGDLNKLVFWIALPALLFRSVARAEAPGAQTFQLIGLLLGATLAVLLLGWLAAGLLRLPVGSRGTLAQSAFRGNLAYVSLPILDAAFHGQPNGRQHFATAVISLTVIMGLYNVLSVIVLQSYNGRLSWESARSAGVAIFTNPLLLASMGGLAVCLAEIPVPVFLDRALESLGGASVPVALLCIGGSLAGSPREGAGSSGVLVAALLKTAVLPLLVWAGNGWIALDPGELRIAMVMAACPTAASAYVMVRQMGGNEPLASRSIVLSTLLSFVAIPICLWITR